MEKISVTSLATGLKFTASIGQVVVSGTLYVPDQQNDDHIYLLQNKCSGSEPEGEGNMMGYEYSWSVRVREGWVMLQSDDVTGFTTEDIMIRNPEYISPEFIFPGTRFKGMVKDVEVEGVLHSDGYCIYVCFNSDKISEGAAAPDMHGYTNSYYLGSTTDRSSGVISFPSRRITITEYEPHPLSLNLLKKSIELRDTINKNKVDYDKGQEELEKLRHEAVIFVKRKSRPAKGMGYNIFYNDEKGTIAFGCGEVTVTTEEVAGFVKIISALQYRDFHQGENLVKAIELSKRLIDA